MDTSKEYIEMCFIAYEIQDISFRYQGTKDYWNCYNCGGDSHCHDLKNCGQWVGVWLPRQDDLQGLIFEEKIPAYIFFRFNDWYLKRDNYGRMMPYRLSFNSLEQLWLAFVMEKKFNKIWNGQEWISNNTF